MFRRGIAFLFFAIFTRKNAQNRPENPQNKNLAKIRPKNDEFMNSMPLEAIFGECLNYKSGPRILIWPTEVPFLNLIDGHKC